MITLRAALFYDQILAYWEKPAVSRRIYRVLIIVFMSSALLIALNSFSLLPRPVAGLLPASPFAAIRLAFSLILAVEVVELIFAMAESVSLAMAKQLEIMALLLLRESFTDISHLNTQAPIEQEWFILMQVAVTAVSGLLLFVCRGLFLRWHVSQGHSDLRRYIVTKKCISLLLLLAFLLAGGYDLYRITAKGEGTVFFHIFYTVLIFTDILLVLVGQYYAPSFQATFRNSGYAVSTMLMRLSMGAPHHIGAILCVCAGAYLLGLTKAIARFAVAPKAAPDTKDRFEK